MPSIKFPSLPNTQSTYTSLPDSFFQKIKPTPVRDPKLLLWNEELAEEFGLGSWIDDKFAIAQVFSGNSLPEGLDPFAQAYAGHQFGHFTMLGDGRATMMGEFNDRNGRLFDFQWKGSGRTKYSRGGDGRATLGAMLREYLISESLFYLGIPTTRSLAVVTTGENVLREEIQTGAVLTRVASSHIRVGTFEYAYHFSSEQEILALLEYSVTRHYPELKQNENLALSFLEAVMKKQVKLLVHWMRVGFVHGVMNTDNTSISGESIDFGPCAFLNGYSSRRVFSSIDQNGRYAFSNQLGIIHWNLSCLANALLPLIHKDTNKAIEQAKGLLANFEDWLQESYIQMLGEKIGIPNLKEKDLPIVQKLFQWMQDHQADFTNTFLVLEGAYHPKEEIYQSPNWKNWYDEWKREIQLRGISETEAQILMQKTNPAWIPRNHLLENALMNAREGSLSLVNILLQRHKNPYARKLGYDYSTELPIGGDANYQTFCGT
ncbi:MAG: YdiU family protein [Leptospira sp.]|nr:YdiU family protein [Leptospira sp.]